MTEEPRHLWTQLPKLKVLMTDLPDGEAAPGKDDLFDKARIKKKMTKVRSADFDT